MENRGTVWYRGHIVFWVLAGLMIVTIPALGARGGNGGTKGGGGGASITVRPLDSTDGRAYYGQRVTFDVQTSASQPGVWLSCSVGGREVLTAWGGFYDGSAWGRVFTLGPTNSWNSGEADCTANLVVTARNGRDTTQATTSFHVYA